MLRIQLTTKFKRDLKKVQKQNKDMDKIKVVMNLLMQQEPLPKSYKDHPLTGNYKGCNDLHIEPDWLLIYRINEERVRFERTGSHSDLFRN